MKGDSFANGNSHMNGASVSNGPGSQEFAQGWPPCTSSIWDGLEPRTPA